MEGVDLSSVSGRERCVLSHAMWVKAVNPEDGVIDTITNAIRPVVFGKLHHPAEAKHTQSCIVKGGGVGDVRDSNPSVGQSLRRPPSISQSPGCSPYNFRST